MARFGRENRVVSSTALFIVGLLALAAICAAGQRLMDRRADRAERLRLLALQPVAPHTFSKALVADLPEPVRRYFSYTIRVGTPLRRVAEIGMRGYFGLGTKAAHRTLRMTAHQVLAAPDGFVWQMSGRAGLMRLSGSDSARWTRFWLGGLIPVARSGGSPDHRRSAFGRMVAEAVFWTPAALLPGPEVTWEVLDTDAVCVTLTGCKMSQSADIALEPDGRPVTVVIRRWSNANPDGVWQAQPFGGRLSEFRVFDGFRLPTRVEGGNFFGTEDYFPFFQAEVTDLRFPVATAASRAA